MGVSNVILAKAWPVPWAAQRELPVLADAYTRLATSEETEVRARFGAGYGPFATRTPGPFSVSGGARQRDGSAGRE